jgi:hypothetical protein
MAGAERRPRRAARGFILFYVAAMVLAISLILLAIGRLQTPSPLFMEKQIDHELQAREEQLLMDFVLSGTRPLKLTTDPRYEEYQRVLASLPASSEKEQLLAMLRAMLEPAGFKIDAPKEEPQAGATTSETATRLKEDGNARDGVVLFPPRRDAYPLEVGGVTYAVRVLPGNALPNLNALPFEPLWRYLVYLKLPESEAKDLAAALIDWHDADELVTEGRGAESGYYYGMHPPYAARNAPIRAWQELNYVRGMTPQRVDLLREHFMLGAADGKGVSPDFIAPEALAAMADLPLETIQNILNVYGRGKAGDDRDFSADVLLGQDTERFDNVVSWQVDPTLLRIRIDAPSSTLTVDYDVRNQRVIAAW